LFAGKQLIQATPIPIHTILDLRGVSRNPVNFKSIILQTYSRKKGIKKAFHKICKRPYKKIDWFNRRSHQMRHVLVAHQNHHTF